MPTAFVTGATGFLGRHLVNVLKEQGWDITAMVRNPEEARLLLGDDITLVRADLTRLDQIQKAMPHTLDCVFHTAANTSTWHAEADMQYDVNVEGTRSILQAVIDRNVKRMVHVSSISVFGDHHGTITEDTPRLGAESWINYVSTKSYAERKVKEACDRGLDAVIVNPTHIIGQYDSHNWARLILLMAKGELPGTPPGAGNFANARAVAEATVAAYHHGKTAQNYILGGPKASFYEFLTTASEMLGTKRPSKPMPAFILKTLALFLSFSKKRPMVTREEAHFSCENANASSVKAIKELNYTEIPLKQSIQEAVDYLSDQGLLQTDKI